MNCASEKTNFFRNLLADRSDIYRCIYTEHAPTLSDTRIESCCRACKRRSSRQTSRRHRSRRHRACSGGPRRSCRSGSSDAASGRAPVCPPGLKVRTPAHTKQLGWCLEFEFRVTHIAAFAGREPICGVEQPASRQRRLAQADEGRDGVHHSEGRTIRGDEGHLMLGERIASQSEVIGDIVSGYSMFRGVPHRQPSTVMPLIPWSLSEVLCE